MTTRLSCCPTLATHFCFFFLIFRHRGFSFVTGRSFKVLPFCFPLACFIYVVGTLHYCSLPSECFHFFPFLLGFMFFGCLVCGYCLRAFYNCRHGIEIGWRASSCFSQIETETSLHYFSARTNRGLHTTCGTGYCQMMFVAEELLFLSLFCLFLCGKVLRPKGSEENHSHFNWWVLYLQKHRR